MHVYKFNFNSIMNMYQKHQNYRNYVYLHRLVSTAVKHGIIHVSNYWFKLITRNQRKRSVIFPHQTIISFLYTLISMFCCWKLLFMHSSPFCDLHFICRSILWIRHGVLLIMHDKWLSKKGKTSKRKYINWFIQSTRPIFALSLQWTIRI